MEEMNKPKSVELFGKFVKLLPMDLDRDIERLFEITCGRPFKFKDNAFESYDCIEVLWKYMFMGPFNSSEEMKAFYRNLMSGPATLVFTIFENNSNSQVGSISYICNSSRDKKVEISVVWLSPAVQRTGCCLESVYLLLENAFDQDYQRVEWKCCTMNYRSARFAEKIGFKLDVQASEWCIIKGYICDVYWFSLMKDDWLENRKSRVKSLIAG